MARTVFQQQLTHLDDSMQEMAELVEDALTLTFEAFSNGTWDEALDLHGRNGQIARCESDIESQCMRLLLRQQPVADDLRSTSAALRAVPLLSRMGTTSLELYQFMDRLALDETDADKGKHKHKKHKAKNKGKKNKKHADVVAAAADAEASGATVSTAGKGAEADGADATGHAAGSTSAETLDDAAAPADGAHAADTTGKKLLVTPALKKMATQAFNMAALALEAYLERDTGKADDVEDMADMLDDLEDKVETEALDVIREKKSDPHAALETALAASYLSRLADFALDLADLTPYASGTEPML
jgi:phosphate uptake regulator